MWTSVSTKLSPITKGGLSLAAYITNIKIAVIPKIQEKIGYTYPLKVFTLGNNKAANKTPAMTKIRYNGAGVRIRKIMHIANTVIK